MSSLGRGTAKRRSMTCWPFSTMNGLYRRWRRNMSDNLTKRDQRDRSKINMHEDFEVKYWTKATWCFEGRAAEGGRQGRQFGRRRSQTIGGVTEARGMLAIFGARPARFSCHDQSQLF